MNQCNKINSIVINHWIIQFIIMHKQYYYWIFNIFQLFLIKFLIENSFSSFSKIISNIRVQYLSPVHLFSLLKRSKKTIETINTSTGYHDITPSIHLSWDVSLTGQWFINDVQPLVPIVVPFPTLSTPPNVVKQIAGSSDDGGIRASRKR